MSVSAGTAYVDVLPNMAKFGPALAAEGSTAGSALKKFAAVGGLALGAVAIGSVKMAADFEKSMRNVNSIAELSEGQFQSLSEGVLDLAGPTAQAPKTLADGLYDLVSSGFDAKDSLTILESAAYAATAGMTTTDVAVKGVAAVLNAYNLPASEAANVSDTLFQTVKRGVISFEELSTGIGDTLPFAASLGVGLDELGAATSTMTLQGLGASETFTRIRNLIQTLIKPGDDLTAAFKELGVESGEALIKQKGFQGALEALIGTTDGSKAAVAKLFPNIRSLGGALALTGKNAKDAEADLKSFADVSGATKDTFDEQAKSLAVQWQELSANLQVLAIKIGNTLLPVLTDIVRFLNEDFADAFNSVKDAVGDVVGPIADSLGPAIEKLGPVFDVAFFAAERLFDIFIFNAKLGAAAIGLILDVVGKLADVLSDVAGFAADAFGTLKDAVGDAAGETEDLVQVVKTISFLKAAGEVDTFNSAISGMGNAVAAGVGKATGGFKNFEQEIGETMKGVGRSAALAIGEVVGVFFKVGHKMATALADGIKSTGNAAIDAAKKISGDAAKAAAGESPQFGKSGKLLGQTLTKSLASTIGDVGKAGQQIAQAGARGSDSQRGQFANSGRAHGQAVASGIRGAGGATAAAASAISIAAAAQARAAVGSFQAAGASMGNALAAGLRSAIGGVAAAANALAAAAARANNHRASGGPVSRGSSYIVGEKGQELFVPKTDGYIVPNHALPAFSGIAGAARADRVGFVIENWKTGEGYFKSIADGAIDTARTFDGQRGRMRRT